MERLFVIRYVYLVAVFFTFLNSIVILFLGVIDAIHGYSAVFTQAAGKHQNNIGIYFLESLDKFLVAFVFLMFSLGIMKLFFFDKTSLGNLPAWLHIESFKDLKVLLWETILVTLVVLSLSSNVKNSHELTWEVLILPVIILILSISLFLMRKE
jgi:uncharacterized membrane protein YqhA